MNEFIEKLIGRLSDMFAESEDCVHKMCESKTDEECNMVTCEQCYVAEMNKIVKELAEEYKPSMTKGGCVDCDDCEHRSEDCLCDISENEEVCPLVSNNGWIPCNERLPEDDDDVICWYEYYRFGEYNGMYQTYGIGHYYKSMDFWGGEVSNGHKCKVIAWQHLPASYKPKGEQYGEKQ